MKRLKRLIDQNSFINIWLRKSSKNLSSRMQNVFWQLVKIFVLCIDDSSVSQIVSWMKLNLIVISITLVANWLQKTQIHLNSENKFEKWVVKHTYDDIKMNKLTVKLFKMIKSCWNKTVYCEWFWWSLTYFWTVTHHCHHYKRIIQQSY
jgi:hypothetical protein